MVRIEFYITRNTLQLSEMRTPRYSVKRTDFAVPLAPRLYKLHCIMQTLAGLSHKIVRHHTNWTIILALLRIVLASGYSFLLSYSNGELLNPLNGTSTHCHAYRKYPGSLRSRTPLYLDDTIGVRIIDVPLYLPSLATKYSLPARTYAPKLDLESQPLYQDEPTYCLCNQVSLGEMICCDNKRVQQLHLRSTCVVCTITVKLAQM